MNLCKSNERREVQVEIPTYLIFDAKTYVLTRLTPLSIVCPIHINKRKASFRIHYTLIYLLSTNKICIAMYAKMMKALAKIAKLITSGHRAWVSKPKELKIVAPGTVMSNPYFLSVRVRYVTSLTISDSKP